MAQKQRKYDMEYKIQAVKLAKEIGGNLYVDENGNLKKDSEENRKRYELQQKQRYMERSIRSTKRKLISVGSIQSGVMPGRKGIGRKGKWKNERNKSRNKRQIEFNS